MRELRRRCSSCRWWSGGQWCRVEPPRIDPGTGRGHWPSTEEDDYCKQWEPNENVEVLENSETLQSVKSPIAELSLEDASRMLTGDQYRAYCWLWLLTPRFGGHLPVRRHARDWRKLYKTDEAATQAANRRLLIKDA